MDSTIHVSIGELVEISENRTQDVMRKTSSAIWTRSKRRKNRQNAAANVVLSIAENQQQKRKRKTNSDEWTVAAKDADAENK